MKKESKRYNLLVYNELGNEASQCDELFYNELKYNYLQDDSNIVPEQGNYYIYSNSISSINTDSLLLNTDVLTSSYLINLTTKSTYYLINDVLYYNYTEVDRSIDSTGISEDYHTTISDGPYTNLPLFLQHRNIIKIPTKVEYALRRFMPKPLLKNVYPEFEVAVELCLLFISQLTSTCFESLSDKNPAGWKTLKAEYLRDFLCNDPLTYKNVKAVLEYPLETGAIVECDHKFCPGIKSFNYRLGEAYIKKGIVEYELKTTEAKRLLEKRHMRWYANSTNNPICNNLMKFYSTISLPRIEEIVENGKSLARSGYKTKKGKRLVLQHKHSKDYFNHPEELSFVEEAIKIFQYLTDGCLMMPKPGNDKSGGRIVDSFTLMPSWIREMITINGERIAECDYSCLHPNIAMSIYGGSQEFLTHAKVAEAAGIELELVKQEHLSFFNKAEWQMKQSPLYDYYSEIEPQMMSKIILEKNTSEYGHAVTSMRMFKKEVEIMEDVVEELNNEGIYVGYIYDALFCEPKDALRVKEVMDSVILEHGVKTTAKINGAVADQSKAAEKQNTGISKNHFAVLFSPNNLYQLPMYHQNMPMN